MGKDEERSGNRKILRRVSALLAPAGFTHTRSTFYVRRREYVLEFIHLHKFSFDSGFRIHAGLRVLNDTDEAPGLNGPHSDSYRGPNPPNGVRQYDFRYGVHEESIRHCAEEIARWCLEVAEPWFARLREPSGLLNDPVSPLREGEKARLRQALEGDSDPNCLRASEEQLGLA
jgi:hypothetical protein